MHMVGHAQRDTGMPARPIEHEHDLLAGTGSRLACEGGELHCKDRNADGGWQMGQMEEGPSRSGMDKADQRAPREAMLHGGHGPLPDRGPDPTPQRFEADPMFVGRPQLDRRVGKRGRYRLYEGTDLFLQVACCSASARASRGRWTCKRRLARTRERQPRWWVTG